LAAPGRRSSFRNSAHQQASTRRGTVERRLLSRVSNALAARRTRALHAAQRKVRSRDRTLWERLQLGIRARPTARALLSNAPTRKRRAGQAAHALPHAARAASSTTAAISRRGARRSDKPARAKYGDDFERAGV